MERRFSALSANDLIGNCLYYIETQDYQSAIESAEQVINLYPNNLEALVCLGKAYSETGQFDLALDSLKKAEMYAIDKQELVGVYGLLGLICTYIGDLDNALFYYDKSLKLAIELGEKETEAANLNNIAWIFQTKGELDKALSYYEKSLSLSSEKDKAITYNNIALICNKKEEYAKSVNYLKKALTIDTIYANHHESGKDMLNLGAIYIEMEDFDNAFHNLQKGLEIIKKLGDKYWEAEGYKYLGLHYAFKGDKKLAEDYFTKAYEIFKLIGAEADAQDALDSIRELKQRSKIQQ